MTGAKRHDHRLLSKEQQTLIAKTRHPLVKNLTDDDLAEVVAQLCEHRDRARATGRFKRGELRSQSMNAGVVRAKSPTSESDGHRAKRTMLVAAVKRANRESERRRNKSARNELVSNAKRALTMKKAARTEIQRPSSRTAHDGMHPIPNADIAPSGALEQEGQRPVLERSRKVR